jgi:hypothetical protein
LAVLAVGSAAFLLAAAGKKRVDTKEKSSEPKKTAFNRSGNVDARGMTMARSEAVKAFGIMAVITSVVPTIVAVNGWRWGLVMLAVWGPFWVIAQWRPEEFERRHGWTLQLIVSACWMALILAVVLALNVGGHQLALRFFTP